MDAPALRSRIESAFGVWARLMIRGRWLAIGLSLAVTALALVRLPELTIDNSTESFLHPDDPVVVTFNQFRDRFSRDDNLVIAIDAPVIFDLGFLERLRALHRDIEEQVPYLEEVTSLVNARSTRGEGDTLIVEDLMEDWPQGETDVAILRERVFANPLYVDALISHDGLLTTLTIEPQTYSSLGEIGALDFEAVDASPPGDAAELPPYLTARESDELWRALSKVIERHQAPDFQLHVGGALAVTQAVNAGMTRDMGVFLPLALSTIMLFLGILFRRFSGVLIPVSVVGLSLVTSLGVMVWLDIPGSTVIQILPIFLLAVGVCDAVHVLTIVYRRLAEGATKEQAIVDSLTHSGLAIVMTSLTTAAGMASFMTAELAIIAHLGILAPIGVMLALGYTLVLLPALLAVLPLRTANAEKRNATALRLGQGLARLGGFTARHPWPVVIAGCGFMLLCLAGASQVRFSHNGLEWFDEDEPIRQAFELIDERLRGVITMEVVVDSGRENGLHDPELLRRLEAAAAFAEATTQGELFVGKATSIVDITKETHQALNENRPEYRVVPAERQLVAQELLLFENSGSDDLERIVDSSFREARLTLRVPWADALLYPDFLETLMDGIREILGDEVEVEATGLMVVLARILGGVVISMARSYVFALAVITPMMMLLLGSVRRGLLSMIPNLLPVVFVVGVMGWLDINLDASTILIGAMVIGLAVDDTIHFMHKYQRYYEESGDALLAVEQTLTTTGAALLFTSLVLSAGFATFAFASLTNTMAFGLLASSATLVALLADVLIAPALMVLVSRSSERSRDKSALESAGASVMLGGSAKTASAAASRQHERGRERDHG